MFLLPFYHVCKPMVLFWNWKYDLHTPCPNIKFSVDHNCLLWRLKLILTKEKIQVITKYMLYMVINLYVHKHQSPPTHPPKNYFLVRYRFGNSVVLRPNTSANNSLVLIAFELCPWALYLQLQTSFLTSSAAFSGTGSWLQRILHAESFVHPAERRINFYCYIWGCCVGGRGTTIFSTYQSRVYMFMVICMEVKTGLWVDLKEEKYAL